MAGTLLAGVDSSPEARSVATVAEALGRRLGLAPAVAHVVDDRPGSVANALERDRRRQLGLARVWSLFDGLEAAVPGARFRVIYDAPADGLAAEAASEEAALIVVGSCKGGGLEPRRPGGVARALAYSAACPVVVVPPGAEPPAAEERLGDRIVCGVDGGPEDAATVDAAAALSERGGFELVLVHVAEGGPTVASLPAGGVGAGLHDHAALLLRRRAAGMRVLDRAARRAAEQYGERPPVRIDAGDPAATLERVAVEEDAALVVTGTRGRGAVRAGLLGSTAMRVVELAMRPVVIVPPRAEIRLDAGAAPAGRPALRASG